MAIFDLIASGGRDPANVLKAYQDGLASFRQRKADDQTAQLRDLQIMSETRKANNYDEDRALQIRGQEAALKGAEFKANTMEEDRARQMEQQDLAMASVRQSLSMDRDKFDMLKTAEERAKHTFDLRESERHITAATAEGVDFAKYVTDNKDEIMEVGGDDIDRVVEAIISGDMQPDEIEQMKTTLLAAMPEMQAHNRQLDLLTQKSIAAGKGDAKPGTASNITSEVSKQVKQGLESSDAFGKLEGKFDQDKGLYTKEQGKAVSAVTNTFDTIRKNTARIKRTELDQGAVMNALTELVENNITDDWGSNTFNSQPYKDVAGKLAILLSNPDNKNYSTEQIIQLWKQEFVK